MTQYQAVLDAPRVPLLLSDLKAFGAARGLPAWTYLSERLNRLEHERVILRSWQFACHANELVQPGQYMTLELMRDSFIVMRSGDGSIRAFRNVCRHRGARLLDGSGACKGSIVCPYHGWTYALDGKLRATPAKRTFPDLELDQYGLSEVQVENFRGIVFVRAEGDGPSVAEAFGPLATAFASSPIETYVPTGTGQTVVWNCNWKTAVDNNLENYHIPIGHPGYDRLLNSDGADAMGAHGVAMTVASLRANPSRAITERLYQELAPRALAGHGPDAANWVFATLPPNIGFNVYPDSMDILQVLPRTAETSLIRYRIFRKPQENRDMRLLRYLNLRINRQVTEEDRALCERVQQGLGTRGYQPGPLSTLEVAVLDFHERIRSAIPETRLADEPAAFAPASATA